MRDLRVAGLDLSLTSTGLCAYNSGKITTHIARSRHIGPARLVTIRDRVLDLVQTVFDASLVLIEGYSYNSRNGGERLGELGGVIRVALYEAGVPYVEVSPPQLKKYATGKGNASKDTVYGAAVHRAGREFATTDEADAWWLCQMALAHLGLPHIEMPRPNRAVLDRIAWPAPREAMNHA